MNGKGWAVAPNAVPFLCKLAELAWKSNEVDELPLDSEVWWKFEFDPETMERPDLTLMSGELTSAEEQVLDEVGQVLNAGNN